jgi:hypothetical protein
MQHLARPWKVLVAPQDTLFLRIIRWYIVSTTGMLQNNSLVRHQQLADYMKLRMIYSICMSTEKL